jgi:hypothetical protein
MTNKPRIPQMNSPSAFDRAATLKRLGLSRDVKNLPLVEKRLRDRSSEVRMRAVEALGRLMHGTHSCLATALRDSNELVRIQAAESIGTNADRRTVAALRRVLHDRSPLVRSYAAAALCRVGTGDDRSGAGFFGRRRRWWGISASLTTTDVHPISWPQSWPWSPAVYPYPGGCKK